MPPTATVIPSISPKNGDVVVTTERMDEYRSLYETGGEGVLLSYLSGCEVESVEGRKTTFDVASRVTV